MIEERLQEFDFSKNEATVYLMLLAQGALTPTEISQKTGLNRSYLYDLLERMKEKGQISMMTIKESACFQATKPERLEEQFTLRAEEFAQLVPKLKDLTEHAQTTNVELHQGKDVFKTLLRDIIKEFSTHSDILIISASEHEFEETEPHLLSQYYRRMKEQKVRERVLIKKGAARLKSSTIEYRELPADLIGNASTFIYATSVAEIVLGVPHFLTITQNKELADARRKLFEALWRMGYA